MTVDATSFANENEEAPRSGARFDDPTTSGQFGSNKSRNLSESILFLRNTNVMAASRSKPLEPTCSGETTSRTKV